MWAPLQQKQAWLRWTVGGFSSRQPGLNPRQAHVSTAVGTGAKPEVFLSQYCGFYPPGSSQKRSILIRSSITTLYHNLNK